MIHPSALESFASLIFINRRVNFQRVVNFVSSQTTNIFTRIYGFPCFLPCIFIVSFKQSQSCCVRAWYSVSVYVLSFYVLDIVFKSNYIARISSTQAIFSCGFAWIYQCPWRSLSLELVESSNQALLIRGVFRHRSSRF